MSMMVQFLRFRRGVPEVVSTRTYPGTDEHAALDRAVALRGGRAWPFQTEAIRILGDNGRTLLQVLMPDRGSTSSENFGSLNDRPPLARRDVVEPSRPASPAATSPI